MAKNLLLCLLLSAPLFAFTTVSAANNTLNTGSEVHAPTDICEAPAPENFKITVNGGHFVSLSWQTSVSGANHTIVLSKKTIYETWVIQEVINHVPGSSYTVGSLEPGREYRAVIATECPSGEISSITSGINFIALIVDLTLAGKTPINPVSIGCDNIEYERYEWLGFKVWGASNSNAFEVEINGPMSSPIGSINRVSTPNPIVAVNFALNFPTPGIPVLENVNPEFQLMHLKPNGNVSIGWVKLEVNFTNPPTIDLCQVLDKPLDKPWNNIYSFSVIHALSVIEPPGGSTGGLGYSVNNGFDRFIVQNPFSQLLTVFVPNDKPTYNDALIRILDLTGKLVLEQKVDVINKEITIRVENLHQGAYLLQIQTENEAQVFKIVKSE